MKRAVGLGVLGLSNLTHSAILRPAASLNAEKLKLFGVSDFKDTSTLDKDRFEAFFDNTSALLDNSSVDVVFLPSSSDVTNEAQHELAFKALEKGKHVVFENHLFPSASSARRLFEAASSSKRLVIASRPRQHLPLVSRVFQLARPPVIGSLKGVVINRSLDHTLSSDFEVVDVLNRLSASFGLTPSVVSSEPGSDVTFENFLLSGHSNQTDVPTVVCSTLDQTKTSLHIGGERCDLVVDSISTPSRILVLDDKDTRYNAIHYAFNEDQMFHSHLSQILKDVSEGEYSRDSPFSPAFVIANHQLLDHLATVRQELDNFLTPSSFSNSVTGSIFSDLAVPFKSSRSTDTVKREPLKGTPLFDVNDVIPPPDFLKPGEAVRRKYLDIMKVLQDLPNTLEVRLQRIEYSFQIGLNNIRKNHTEAIKHFRDSFELAKSLDHKPPETHLFSNLSEACLYTLEGKYDEAILPFQKVFQMTDMLKKKKINVDGFFEDMAAYLYLTKNTKSFIPVLSSIVETLKTLKPNFYINFITNTTQFQLAWAHFTTNNTIEAIKVLRDCEALIAKASLHGKGEYKFFRNKYCLGEFIFYTNQPEQSLEKFMEALESLELGQGQSWHEHLALLEKIATCHTELGNADEAKKFFDRALAIATSTVDKERLELRSMMASNTSIMETEATKNLRISIEKMEEEKQTENRSYTSALLLYAGQLEKTGEIDKAIEALEKARQVFTVITEPDSDELLNIIDPLAALNVKAAVPEKACHYAKLYLEIAERKGLPLDSTSCKMHRILGTHCYFNDDYQGSVFHGEKAICAVHGTLDHDPHSHMWLLEQLSFSHCKLGNHAKAVEYYSTLIETSEKHDQVHGQPFLTSVINYTASLEKEGRIQDAIDNLKRIPTFLKNPKKVVTFELQESVLKTAVGFLCRHKQYEIAQQILDEHLKDAQKVHGKNSINTVRAFDFLTEFYMMQELNEKALEYGTLCWETLSTLGFPQGEVTRDALVKLSESQFRLGKYKEARETTMKIFQVEDPAFFKENPGSLLSVYATIARLSFMSEDPDTALDFSERIIDELLGSDQISDRIQDLSNSFEPFPDILRQKGDQSFALSFVIKMINKYKTTLINANYPLLFKVYHLGAIVCNMFDEASISADFAKKALDIAQEYEIDPTSMTNIRDFVEVAGLIDLKSDQVLQDDVMQFFESTLLQLEKKAGCHTNLYQVFVNEYCRLFSEVAPVDDLLSTLLKCYNADPSLIEQNHTYCVILLAIGECYKAKDRLDLALPFFEEGFSKMSEFYPKDDPYYLDIKQYVETLFNGFGQDQ